MMATAAWESIWQERLGRGVTAETLRSSCWYSALCSMYGKITVDHVQTRCALRTVSARCQPWSLKVHGGRKAFHRVVVVVEGQPKLLQVIRALHSSGGPHGRLVPLKQQSNQIPMMAMTTSNSTSVKPRDAVRARRQRQIAKVHYVLRY